MGTLLESSRLNEDFAFIRDIVYRMSRISLGEHKQQMVLSRISKRVRALGFTSVQEYCSYLRKPSGREELSSLIDVISTNHTYFFRETSHFDYLTREILRKRDPAIKEPLRVWSAACSSGEEPYSVAMILAEQQRLNPRFSWRMEATDISSIVLKKAEEGTYPAAAMERVPRVLKDRYLEQSRINGSFTVNTELKRYIRFTRLNLFEIPQSFPKIFDLILCRNVMIYFDRETREQLVNDLCSRMSMSGTLFVGHSESLGGINHPLRMVHPAVYIKERP